MNPCTPFSSQHRYNLTAGEQPDLIAVYILDRQQLAGHTGKTHFVRRWVFIGGIAGTRRRARLKGPQICQQAIDQSLY
jgi:hypothetical protein